MSVSVASIVCKCFVGNVRVCTYPALNASYECEKCLLKETIVLFKSHNNTKNFTQLTKMKQKLPVLHKEILKMVELVLVLHVLLGRRVQDSTLPTKRKIRRIVLFEKKN